MALTQISTGMLASGDGTVDLNIDNGTFVVDVSTSRVGIGGSPDSLLHVAGAANLRIAYNGTSVNYMDADTNIFRSGNGSERMRIDGATGNVGIGTSSINSFSGYTTLEINNATSGALLDLSQGDSMRGRLVATATTMSLETSGSIPIIFQPAGTERMRIFSDGDVSIGMTANYAKLNVNGDVRAENSKFLAGREDAASPAFAFHDDSDTGIFNINPNILAFSTAGSERMRIDQNGWVNVNANIATDNPADSAGLHFGWNYSNAEGESLIVFNKGAGSVGGLLFSDNSANGTPSERMRITSAGDVLVGTSTNLDVLAGTPKIQVGDGTGHSSIQFYSNTDAVGALYFGDSTAGISRYSGYIEYRHSDDSMAFRAGAASVLTLFSTVVASEVDVSIKGGKKIELQTTSGTPRGYISAQETNTGGTHHAGLIIATSGGENITFKDGAIAGTTNMVIDGSGDVSMPYKAYAYGTITESPTNPTNNYGLPLTTASYQNCTPQTNSTHGPGITITKAGFYTLYMSFLYDPLSHNYVYLGWCCERKSNTSLAL